MTDACERAFGRERGRNVCAPTRGVVGPWLLALRCPSYAGGGAQGAALLELADLRLEHVLAVRTPDPASTIVSRGGFAAERNPGATPEARTASRLTKPCRAVPAAAHNQRHGPIAARAGDLAGGPTRLVPLIAERINWAGLGSEH
jgi:hypothetical protein